MLDSGAFSSWTKGKEINIDQYIDFIKSVQDCVDFYICLDVIGDPIGTLKNQNYMESKGLNPMPVFHRNEDYSFLQALITKYDYIGLGGMASGVGIMDIQNHLDRCFELICNQPNRLPKVKVHGFGLTAMELMLRYPWYSVDSSSWALTGAFGSIIIPAKNLQGSLVYNEPPVKIKISDRAPQSTQEGIHFKTMSPAEQDYVLNYITSKGYKLGKSSYKEVDSKYKLQKNERWVIKNKEVEVREELGVSNDHNMRDKWNIQYFVELEKYFQPYPWAFKPNKLEGFGL